MYKSVQIIAHEETKEGTWFRVLVPNENLMDAVRKFSHNNIIDGELRLNDGRHISADQRKKIYATLADIALCFGYVPEELKGIMKFRYISSTGEDYFSLSNCSMTTARKFANYIIDFALEWNVPLRNTLIERTDDIDASIYASLKHKKCVVCGLEGEVHHWDAIGMGYDRSTIDDSHLRKLCLCRVHHTEAHQTGREVFEHKYHVYGIIFKG